MHLSFGANSLAPRNWFATKPLEQEHQMMLKMCNSRIENLNLQIGWALGSWKVTISKILAALNSEEAMVKMGLSGRSESPNCSAVADHFATVTADSATGRTWAMAGWSDSWSHFVISYWELQWAVCTFIWHVSLLTWNQVRSYLSTTSLAFFLKALNPILTRLNRIR